MGLPTSGQISLDEIHVEAGGISTTQATINDSDIRGLIGKADSTQMAFSEWYGASGFLDTQYVTVATAFLYYQTRWGFYIAPYNLGSISDGTSNIYGGAAVEGIMWSSGNQLTLRIAGNRGRVAWTSMNINGTSFTAVSATYNTSSTITNWNWYDVANPFPAAGSVATVNWS